MTAHLGEHFLYNLRCFKAVFELAILLAPKRSAELERPTWFPLFFKGFIWLASFIKIIVVFCSATLYDLYCLSCFERRRNFRKSFRIIEKTYRTIITLYFIISERHIMWGTLFISVVAVSTNDVTFLTLSIFYVFTTSLKDVSICILFKLKMKIEEALQSLWMAVWLI